VYHGRGLVYRVDRQTLVDPFDQKHGTDTSGTRNIASLDVVDSPVALYAVQYQPSSAQLVRDQLDKLDIDSAEFTFIDFGSGKGRVLLIAAEYPFREIIGIEFSRELHEIALRNISRSRRPLTREIRVRSINVNAAEVELPRGDLVCFFNNPFGPPVISRVAERLVKHHRDRGCRILVIYVDPRHRDVFERCGIFRLLDETQDAVIFTNMPG
jgi:predicted RNA methylase